MRKEILVLMLGLLISTLTYGQEEDLNSNFGIGFHLSQNQNDFGLGLNIVSPYFANDKMALRLRGNLMWNEHLNETNDETLWSAYSNLSLGFVGVAGDLGGFMRVYGEGGLVVLFPSGAFSTESSELGGYGLFGFEFHFAHHHNYFLEIGAMGTGAVADKVAGKPIYSNGLLINVGYRIQF